MARAVVNVWRTRFFIGMFCLFALLLIVRLYFVQIVHGDDYTNEARGQFVAENTDHDNRGTIYFTRKDGALVAAATMQSGWRIAIHPKDIRDPANVYTQLSHILPLNRTTFDNAIARTADPYEEIAVRLTDEQASAVRALKISGLLLVRDQWRSYPGDFLAAQTVGFVGYKGDIRTGVYGLEKQYQNTLSLSGRGVYVNPFAEIFTNLSDVVTLDPTTRQGSIVTTIEPAVQAELQKILDGVMNTYSPDFAGGIIMDPKTGEIVAMSGVPSFDPNNYNQVKNPAYYQNKLVEGRYELGSIMKPITMASGIDSGVITSRTTYNDTGCITVSTMKVCNFDFRARGVIPMQEILSQSLNVGVSFIANRMGPEIQSKYMHAFGFGEKTGIDVPNEVAGDISIISKPNAPTVNFDTAAFGQGIAVSPIAMIRALAVLANGGMLPSPHVVTRIEYESGISRTVPITPARRVIATSTAEQVTNMLITVVDTSLLKGALKQDHYSIAAKTGTAQIPAKGGGYLPMGTFLHSFFGYFPAHNPRFIVFLFAYKPHGQEYASATLAHPFLDITKFLINYYNIAPDR